MIRKKCVNSIFNKSILASILVLFSVVLSTQSVGAAMTRNETQTMTYTHYFDPDTFPDSPPKQNPWGERQSLASGSVNITHEVAPDKNINGLCVGQVVNFDYDPILTYNATGGNWDTPYGDWCDNTESGCAIDMENGNYQTFRSKESDVVIGKLHWTAIKPQINIVSSDSDIVSCNGITCTVKGSGAVVLKAQITETKTRLWSVFNMHRIYLHRLDESISKTILGIRRDAWSDLAGIASPTDDGVFLNLGFDYLESPLWYRNDISSDDIFDENKKTIDSLEINDSENLSWNVQVGCDTNPECGSMDGTEAYDLNSLTGTKCSDSSGPVVSNTSNGFTWTCGTSTCGAIKTCTDVNNDYICDGVCDSSKNEINNPVDPDECCIDKDSNGICDYKRCDLLYDGNGINDPTKPDFCCIDINKNGVCDFNDPEPVCFPNQIEDSTDPTKCCDDANNNSICDSTEGGSGCPSGQTEDPTDSTKCCADADNDKSCDSNTQCLTGQIVNVNKPTECCDDADGDKNCDCLQCGDGCLAPYIPNQVNLLRGGGAQRAEVKIPAGLWCDVNGNGKFEDGIEGNASHSVVYPVDINSHPTPLNYNCQCEPSKVPGGTPCPANKPERTDAGGNKICCSDEEWNNDKNVCGLGKDAFQKSVQCVCIAKKCSTSGSCIATPVIAGSYSETKCASNCSSSADCSGGTVIPVP